ncbi:MAG: GPW/gp25 family protein [Spirochaetaceae bacterium]|jgi:type VI secretion system protein ImpF|nr:GPW/gp25 family protein [Spirochaetaceae bacterium]
MPEGIQYVGYKAKEEALFKPYLLKRLTDYEPSEKKDRETGAITLRKVKEDVFENIEMLFGSRAHLSHIELREDEELISSVLGFGIIDYCGKSFGRQEREILRQNIIEQLTFFEPRIDPSTIEVKLTDSEDNPSFLMAFRISGTIRVGQLSEELLFISRLNLETGSAEVMSLTE